MEDFKFFFMQDFQRSIKPNKGEGKEGSNERGSRGHLDPYVIIKLR